MKFIVRSGADHYRVVVRIKWTPYTFGRSVAWMKLKIHTNVTFSHLGLGLKITKAMASCSQQKKRDEAIRQELDAHCFPLPLKGVDWVTENLSVVADLGMWTHFGLVSAETAESGLWETSALYPSHTMRTMSSALGMQLRAGWQQNVGMVLHCHLKANLIASVTPVPFRHQKAVVKMSLQLRHDTDKNYFLYCITLLCAF